MEKAIGPGPDHMPSRGSIILCPLNLTSCSKNMSRGGWANKKIQLGR